MINRALYRFFRAVVIGALCGGGVVLLLTIPLGIGTAFADGNIGEGLYLAILPLLIAGSGTLAGMVLIGLPATLILAEYPPETAGTYGNIGMTAGMLAPSIVFLVFSDGDFAIALTGGMFFGPFGLFAGLGAGLSWGGWRETLVTEEPDPTPANPIHDLLF